MTVVVVCKGEDKHTAFLADMERKQAELVKAKRVCFMSAMCSCARWEDCNRRNVTRWHQQG